MKRKRKDGEKGIFLLQRLQFGLNVQTETVIGKVKKQRIKLNLAQE